MIKITSKGEIETRGASVYIAGVWQASGLNKLPKPVQKNGQILTHRIGNFGFTTDEAGVIIADHESAMKKLEEELKREGKKEAEWIASRRHIINGMTCNGNSF